MTKEQKIRAIALEQAVRALAGIRDQPNYGTIMIVDSAALFETFIKEGLFLDE
jgi:hypothetical protein